MQYDDGRFARHPRFRFFTLNTEMQHHALQMGRVYVRQHPGDGQLSLDELRDMVGRQGEAFSSRVLHYASSLRGTKQYWQRQRSRLLSMVDTLGLPTIFFTHSAADLQWPELVDSSVLTILTPGLQEPRQSLRIQLLLTVSSTTGSWSLSRSSTLGYSEQLTTG